MPGGLGWCMWQPSTGILPCPPCPAGAGGTYLKRVSRPCLLEFLLSSGLPLLQPLLRRRPGLTPAPGIQQHLRRLLPCWSSSLLPSSHTPAPYAWLSLAFLPLPAPLAPALPWRSALALGLSLALTLPCPFSLSGGLLVPVTLCLCVLAPLAPGTGVCGPAPCGQAGPCVPIPAGLPDSGSPVPLSYFRTPSSCFPFVSPSPLLLPPPSLPPPPPPPPPSEKSKNVRAKTLPAQQRGGSARSLWPAYGQRGCLLPSLPPFLFPFFPPPLPSGHLGSRCPPLGLP